MVLGDSLAAAYGISQSSGWVALLEDRLKQQGLQYTVVNASISGETSAGGRARAMPLLEREHPAVLILELGANDGLRGLPPAQMKANLAAIIEQAQKHGTRVLLLGMKLPPNYGPEYTQRFEAVFRELQARYRTGWVPFMLEDFATNEELFQPDRIHPNEKAQPLMLERVWQALRPLLK